MSPKRPRGIAAPDAVSTPGGIEYAVRLAHEINNCLTPVMLNVQHLLERPDLDPDTLAVLSSVLAMAGRGRGLVQRVLRQLSNRDAQESVEFAAEQAIRGALPLITAMAAPGVTVALAVDPDCPRLVGDPQRLGEALINVCINGVQAMAATGGALVVAVSAHVANGADTELPAGSYVRIEVRDSGSGMDGRTLQQLFTPFFTTRRAEHGTGLGLVIAKEIISAMGGVIRVDSTPAVGTRFQIYLPAAAEAGHLPAA